MTQQAVACTLWLALRQRRAANTDSRYPDENCWLQKDSVRAMEVLRSSDISSHCKYRNKTDSRSIVCPTPEFRTHKPKVRRPLWRMNWGCDYRPMAHTYRYCMQDRSAKVPHLQRHSWAIRLIGYGTWNEQDGTPWKSVGVHPERSCSVSSNSSSFINSDVHADDNVTIREGRTCEIGFIL